MPIPLSSSTVDMLPPTPTAPITAAPAPFPARTKQATALISGIRTEVKATQFSDKILVTISQEGKLGHWVHVPLASSDPALSQRRRRAPPTISYDDEEPGSEEFASDLLPLSHLTATTILGAGSSERDTLGQLLAAQIGTALATRNPNESRLLVLGMGFAKGMTSEIEGDVFGELVGLTVGCL